MTRLCQERTGLFPSPLDILSTCSCPDWASMCKYVAAVLYGIGARLDQQPELLFTLRKVDQQDLIAKAGSDLSRKPKGFTSAKALASDDLSAMFGIEIAPATPPARAAGATVAAKRPAAARSTLLSAPRKMSTPATPKASAPERRIGKQRLTPAKRQAISARMREYWAARRQKLKKGTNLI
jgi:uncharacterized Zn finger protein